MLLSTSAGFAQGSDCIENIAGRTVCGSEAEAVRARMRAEAQYAKDPNSWPKNEGSLYPSWTNSVFVRGGYGFHGHLLDESVDFSAPMGAVGFRHTISRYNRSRFLFEMETVYARDSGEVTDGIDVAELTVWGVTGLASIRWQYDTRAGISPFVSAGIGPSYWKGKLDPTSDPDIFTISDDGWAFGYSGRAGFEAALSDSISFEAAYRYLGATNDGSFGIHAAEAGLNFNW